MKQSMLFAVILLIFAACKNATPTPENVTDITEPPVVSPADQQFKGAFAMLNGTWEGVFYIYEDSTGQRPGKSRPEITNLEFADLSLKLVREIDVRQEYVSENPYFQRVTIRDRFVNAKGDTETVVSEGVNKVQDGALWCVVQKPDETIVHHGSMQDASTLIWQRDERDPLKIEYFHESVEGDYYKIIGWGYYGDDNPKLSPKTWFVGDYSRMD